MSLDYCIVSIGTLSHNTLWGERAAVRTAHATTTLVRDGGRAILVDPSLPAAALVAHLGERTGLGVSAVTDVFCTTLRPVHRRSLAAFAAAKWWCNQMELEAYRDHLEGLLDSASRLDQEQAALAEEDLALLKRFKAAPEKFSEQVHLFPLPGASVGSAGLLLAPATTTIMVAGDAAITAEHVQRGMVWDGAADLDAAAQSLRDVLEIADVIIPGHDNLMLAPGRLI
jgi:glyoxylase-like metal-dependent hydrolase (beta-lactamase superfamily II)